MVATYNKGKMNGDPRVVKAGAHTSLVCLGNIVPYPLDEKIKTEI
jgi:hypothetical protein